jgi:hypothetical protein
MPRSSSRGCGVSRWHARPISKNRPDKLIYLSSPERLCQHLIHAHTTDFRILGTASSAVIRRFHTSLFFQVGEGSSAGESLYVGQLSSKAEGLPPDADSFSGGNA